MKQTLIIGIGSPYGDDQIGLLIAEKLIADKQLSQYIPEKLEIFACDRPGLNLLPYFCNKKYQQLIFIDAMMSNAEIGSIKVIEKDKIMQYQSSISTHGFDLSHAITMADALNLLPSLLYIYAIEIDASDSLGECHPSLKLSSEKVIKMIMDKL